MAEALLYIGLGNSARSDDGVGPWLAARLADRGLPAREWHGDGSGMIDLFAAAPRVTVIDATRSGAPPGTLHRFDAVKHPLPRARFRNSTHDFGLVEAVELARRLGELPDRLTVIGIEGADFSPGAGLSAPVYRAATELEAEILRDVSRSRRRR